MRNVNIHKLSTVFISLTSCSLSLSLPSWVNDVVYIEINKILRIVEQREICLEMKKFEIRMVESEKSSVGRERGGNIKNNEMMSNEKSSPSRRE